MKDPIQYKLNRDSPYGTAYAIKHPRTKAMLAVIASHDEGWNHVSVSLENRDPLWAEMCFIKSLFFDVEDLCLQFHPKRSQYVNMHKHCLHIWQPPYEIAKLFDKWRILK